MTVTPSAALPIVSVVVHPDGALVTRKGELRPALTESGQQLVIRELPLLLDPSSVRAAVVAREGGLPARSVYVELDLLGEDRGEQPPSLERWRQAREAMTRTSSRIAALGQLRTALAALVPSSNPDPERAIPEPDRWLSWLAANQQTGERLAAIDEELRTLERTRRDQNEQIAILDAMVRQESSESWWKRWQPARHVRIELDPSCSGEHPLQVELSYQIPGASWSPAYVLDTDRALSKGRFSMRALVVQATGEDWRRVSLSLSSAPCARTVDVPDLAALRLSERQPAVSTGWRELPAGLDALFPDTIAPTPDMSRATSTLVEEQTKEEAKKADRDEDGAFLDDYDDPKTVTFHVPTAAPMSASKGGGILSTVLDAIPMPQAKPSAAAPSGNVGRSPARPSLARDRRVKEPPAEPAPLDVAADWLDYGRMRLIGFDGVSGRRGTLQPIDEIAELREAALPGPAISRFHERRSELAEGTRRTRERPLPPLHVLPAPIGGTDVRIDAVGTVDIPSDARPHSVAVQSWEAALSVAYRAVPREDPRVFRIVTATVAYNLPLLPGPVDIYMDGRLQITSAWSGSPGRGQLKIGLGAEERLIIARNVRYREETAGMLGGSLRTLTTVEISVASALPQHVSVEILERIPVPLDGRSVTVEPLESSPQAAPYKGDPDGPLLKGGRSQILEIRAGGEARASLSYAVTLYKGEKLVGGNNRG